jgi:hypothetical protein
VKKLALPAASAALVALALAPPEGAAYDGDRHELSVRQAAARCEAEQASTFSGTELADIVRGAREPDDPSMALLEIGLQRVEPAARGKKRSVNPIRIAEQSFHGSPNPTRAPYTDSPEDRALQREALPRLPAELLPDRFALDVHAYDSNRAMRNKMLINASQLLCVSLAHADERKSARKLGNLVHMVGDTYSASHVQRSEPEGSPGRCGTEKIEWIFSMDLVVWKNHSPADRESGDWRFACLVEHAAELMRRWAPARKDVAAAPDAGAKRARASREVAGTVGYLCGNVFRADPAVLAQPTGGAAAGYSIASGTDNWLSVFAFWRRQPKDQPIQPVGLTGAREARDFVAWVNEQLVSADRAPYFAYPARGTPDYCEELARTGTLPEALRCTPGEIGWAMEGSPEVDPLVIPPRGGGPTAPQ